MTTNINIRKDPVHLLYMNQNTQIDDDFMGNEQHMIY